MTNDNENLEYLIELDKKLNGTYSNPKRKKVDYGDGWSFDFIEKSYFKKTKIEQAQAQKIIDDVISNELIIYPIRQAKALDETGLLIPEHFFVFTEGYKIIKPKIPTSPGDIQVFLRIGVNQLPDGYDSKFQDLTDNKKNLALIEQYFPGKAAETSKYEK